MNNYKIDANTFDSVIEDLKDLDLLLTERISELHNVDGGKQARHAFIYYRTFVWSVRDKLKSNTYLITKEDERSTN